MVRLPIVPGSDPRIAYGDLVQRGVKGVILEAFGKPGLLYWPANWEGPFESHI